MQIHKIILFLSIFYFSFCSLKYVKKEPNQTFPIRRIFIQYEINTKNLTEKLLLEDMTENYISHHSEFIVYKEIQDCNSFKKEKTGFLKVSFQENYIKKEKIQISLNAKLFDCKNQSVFFETSLEKSYRLKLDKKDTLFIENYKQEFGSEIETKVKPYFNFVQKAFKKIPHFKLTDEEIEEKIEIESL